MDLRDISDEQFQRMMEAYFEGNECRTDADRRHRSCVASSENMRLTSKTGAPFIYDILVLSGGGAKGAFGAGFMQGWGSIPPGPDARPEFDMVTGVSTGALISPFATIGTDEAYTSVADFYANPEKNWIRKRGTFYLQGGPRFALQQLPPPGHDPRCRHRAAGSTSR